MERLRQRNVSGEEDKRVVTDVHLAGGHTGPRSALHARVSAGGNVLQEPVKNPLIDARLGLIVGTRKHADARAAGCDGCADLTLGASARAGTHSAPVVLLVSPKLVLVVTPDPIVAPVVAPGPVSGPGEKLFGSKRQAASEYLCICARSERFRQVREERQVRAENRSSGALNNDRMVCEDRADARRDLGAVDPVVDLDINSCLRRLLDACAIARAGPCPQM